MYRIYVFLLLFPSLVIAADKTHSSVIVDEVISIYDGDTFRVTIHAWPSIIGVSMPVRVNGVDTPEMRGKCQTEKDIALLAKKFTIQTLRSAKTIELRNIKRGKYFRLVADVFADGQSLAEGLINKQLAVRYDGGTKINWC